MQQANPEAYMLAQGLTGWSFGVAMYVQMMMAAQAEGVLQDGWHLLARLHIILREFERADDSEELWQAKRNSLGFGLFTLAEAKALNNNDWLVIAISTVTERDYRGFLAMWGLSFGDSASVQVASLGLPVMPKRFYLAKGNDYCEGLDKPAVDIIDSDGDGYLDAYDAFVDDASEHADADSDGIGDNADTEYNLNLAHVTHSAVQLKSEKNNKCLGVTAALATEGAQAMALTCNSDDQQKWSWDTQGRLHIGSNPAYCLAASALSSGAHLTLALCSGNVNQQWLYHAENNSIQALNLNNAYFDQYSSGEVNLYGFTGNSNQQWQIVP